MNAPKNVIARMTITKRSSTNKIIVEVRSDANFNKFYSWFSQEGRKRKKLQRTSQRNDGLYFARGQGRPGLDVLAAHQMSFNKDIDKVTIKVFKKRAYEKMLTCRPDELGALPAASTARIVRPAAPLFLPSTYTTLQKRMDILTGAK